jgi:hypothetical protein
MYGKVSWFAKAGSLSLRTTESISARAFFWTSGKSIMMINVKERYRGMKTDEDLEAEQMTLIAKLTARQRGILLR